MTYDRSHAIALCQWRKNWQKKQQQARREWLGRITPRPHDMGSRKGLAFIDSVITDYPSKGGESGGVTV